MNGRTNLQHQILTRQGYKYTLSNFFFLLFYRFKRNHHCCSFPLARSRPVLPIILMLCRFFKFMDISTRVLVYMQKTHPNSTRSKLYFLRSSCFVRLHSRGGQSQKVVARRPSTCGHVSLVIWYSREYAKLGRQIIVHRHY
jgi:hypothetical protein